MAFNWQTFKTRTLTAAIFVVVMLAGLLINRWTFFILFSVIHFGCWWEYLRLSRIINDMPRSPHLSDFVFMLAGFSVMLTLSSGSFYLGGISLSEIGFYSSFLFLLLLPLLLALTKRNKLKYVLSCIPGLVYISLSLGLMLNLAIYENSVWDLSGVNNRSHYASFFRPVPFAILIIACMWINDTMAYIIGSLMGKTPLSTVSPKKTWEGTIGGILSTILIVGLLLQYAIRFPEGTKINSYHFYSLPAIASITGVFGDLFESKLKRMAGVKDSGHIMPGHGGFLDRFDSLLVATPFTWLYVYFMMR